MPFHCCHWYANGPPAVGAVTAVTLNVAVVPAHTVLFTGCAVMVGSNASVIVTVNEQLVLLPAASLTVYVTVVTPRLKALEPTVFIPVAGELATVAPVKAQVCTVTAQLSVAVGLFGANVAVHTPTSVVLVTFAGQVIAGAWVSFTVTSNVQLAVLPAASVAVEVTVVVPTGNTLPLAGTDTTGSANEPAAFKMICMFGKPIEANVAGLAIPQSAADI